MSASILLIEPDLPLSKIYQTALTEQGYQVTIKSNAELALKSLDTVVPDLIIIEPQMIEHGGIEFLYELRSYQDWQAIPILIHSLIPSSVLDLMEAALKQLNVAGHYYKPKTSLKQLINATSELLNVNAKA